MTHDSQRSDIEKKAQERTIIQFAEANLRLRCESEQLQSILESTTALVYMVSRDGRFLFINRVWERVFNMRNEKTVGRPLTDFFSKETADQFMANNLNVIKANKTLQFTETVPHHDGIRTYLTIKAPLLDTDGQPYGISGISTEITIKS